MSATIRPRRSRTRATLTDRLPQITAPGAWKPRGPRNGLTFVDFLCGAGGSSAGLANAGWDLQFAVNHWDVAIATHRANFPDVWHECLDVTTINLRKLPSANLLWASPICTESSPAGGTSTGWSRSQVSKRSGARGADREESVRQEGMERTRATFWSVIQYAEVHRPELVFVENVPDVADRWALFDNWLRCMDTLGYPLEQAAVLSVNSAHIGGDGIPYAPQWRDRLYLAFVRKDLGRRFDLTPAPRSLCFECGEVVAGVQYWCPAAQGRELKIGRYRRKGNSSYGQYWYVCPRGCRRKNGQPARVEPFILPAIAAIDLADLGEPIADGQLVRNSLQRIEVGQDMFWRTPGAGLPPFAANANHDDTRVYLVDGEPLAARTTKIGEGLCLPPFTMIPGGRWPDGPISLAGPMRTQLANGNGSEALVTTPDGATSFLAIWRNNVDAVGLHEPLPTVTAGGHHHSVVSPPAEAFQVAHYGGQARATNLCRSIREPLGTVVANGAHHALVLPYYSKDPAYTTAEPLGTVSTRDRYAIVPGGQPSTNREVRAKDGGTVTMLDCRHRMLRWDESARAQVLPIDDGYIITGTGEERTAQAGNAVSSNASQWLGRSGHQILEPGGAA